MSLRRVCAALAIPVMLAGMGCSKKKSEPTETDTDKPSAAAQDCGDLLKPADPGAKLPSTLPAGVTGATFYSTEKQGATTYYYAYIKGERGDIVSTRDAIKSALTGAGLQIEGTDQEPGSEAELEFKKGSIAGTVQVTQLCVGHLRIRYKSGPD